jgi:hypothetical protein
LLGRWLFALEKATGHPAFGLQQFRNCLIRGAMDFHHARQGAWPRLLRMKQIALSASIIAQTILWEKSISIDFPLNTYLPQIAYWWNSPAFPPKAEWISAQRNHGESGRSE